MSHFNIIKLDAISSTNEFLKKKCKSSKCKDGEIIWAKDQTNGKGQSLNKWLSQRGKSLTVSVYKEFDQLRTSNAFVLNACILTFDDCRLCPHVPKSLSNDRQTEFDQNHRQ